MIIPPYFRRCAPVWAVAPAGSFAQKGVIQPGVSKAKPQILHPA